MVAGNCRPRDRDQQLAVRGQLSGIRDKQ